MLTRETRLSTSFKKMSFHWKFTANLTVVLFILLTETTNASPAPPYLPIMTSHTENLDIENSKILPAGTYPDYAAAALARATFNDTELNVDKPHDLVKRSWGKLHGSWGKRNSDKNNYDNDYNPNMENYNAANNILSESKEDDFIDDGNQDYQDLLKYSEIYRFSPNSGNNLLDQDLLYEPKRSPNNWNKFKGSWGKRQTGWNKLNAAWGKKRSADWGKLNAAWGKRNAN